MSSKKKIHPKIKHKLHPRNKHRERYDFKQLIATYPDLSPFVSLNKYNDESVDFFNPKAVLMLNTALLKHHYGINNWKIPEGYLCPPIPGRADYIHYIADLLASKNTKYGVIPKGKKIKCLDIGVGANCIYPIIGVKEYGWSFIGVEVDKEALDSAKKIIASNSFLKEKVELRLQSQPKNIFHGVIQKDSTSFAPTEWMDVTICNPPFYGSFFAVQLATKRKLKNLKKKKNTPTVSNFGGKNNELWCEGGEKIFIENMILQSKEFSASCFWFSTLVSKQSNLQSIYKALQKVKATEVKTIPMGQGNKISRIVAWTFLDKKQQKSWVELRWE